MKYFIQFTAAASFALTAQAAMAETEITWWHGMGGHLGDVVNQIAEGFNESQDDYTITPVFKGSYEETLTAAIAAFRAGEQPNIVQVFDAGAATVIGAQGARGYKLLDFCFHVELLRTAGGLQFGGSARYRLFIVTLGVLRSSSHSSDSSFL